MPKIILERHDYAPEMNRAFIISRRGTKTEFPNGRTYGLAGSKGIPGIRSIQDARASLFPRLKEPFIHARITKIYPEPFQGLNKTWQGRVSSRAEALAFARAERLKNAGGILNDGTVLPAPTVTVKTQILG